MILNQAKDIRMGEKPVQRVYHRGQVIWERESDRWMPEMAGVTDYFDYRQGLTAQGWENLGGGTDISWTGMEIQPDGAAGVRGTAQSYGAFTSAYAPSRTVYAVFRTDPVGYTRSNPIIIGSVGQWGVNGGFFSIQIEGYTAADTIGSDQCGIGIPSTVTSEVYHVAALTRSADGLNTLYVDGVRCGTLQNGRAYGDAWAVGLLRDAAGTILAGPGVLQHIRMLAIADRDHTAEQVAANSDWIRRHIIG